MTTEHQIILSTMIMHPNIHQGINMYNSPHLVVDRAYHEDSFIYDNYEDNELPSVQVRDKSQDKKAISKVNKKMQITWKNPFTSIAFMIIKPFTITAEFFNNLFYSIRTAIKLKWSSEDIISFISAFLLISSFALTIYFKEMKQKRIPELEYEYINATEHINSIFNLISIIRFHYKDIISENFLPFKIKSADLNLFYNVQIYKS